MERNMICKPATYRTEQDLLNFAPCPPPMLNYSEFREHALNRNLSHQEVCNITRRCLPSDTDAEEYCSLTSTTTRLTSPVTDNATVNISSISTTTEYTSWHETDYSIYSSTFSIERTTVSPTIYTSSSNTLIIVLSVICPVAIVVLCIFMLVFAKRRRKKIQRNMGITREHHSLQISQDMGHRGGINKSESTSRVRNDSACDETDMKTADGKKDHSESNIKHDDKYYLENESTVVDLNNCKQQQYSSRL